MFGHRKCFERFQTFTGVSGGYRNPPGSILGLLGLSGEEEGRLGQAARPSPSSPELDKEGGAAPPFLPLSPSLPFALLLQLGKEGVILPVGVGLLPGVPPPGRPPPPP